MPKSDVGETVHRFITGVIAAGVVGIGGFIGSQVFANKETLDKRDALIRDIPNNNKALRDLQSEQKVIQHDVAELHDDVQKNTETLERVAKGVTELVVRDRERERAR